MATVADIPLDPQKTANWGREQRRRTATAQSRTPNLARFYGQTLPPIHPGEFEFHFDLLRPKLDPFRLRTVDTAGWDDEQSVLTGSLTAFRPDPTDPSSLPIGRGDLIRCRTVWGDNTYDLWTMRCGPPQAETDTGNVSVVLRDDMALLDGTRLDWFFRKTKHRKRGFTADEITIEVCKRLGARVGTMPHATVRQTLHRRGASGLAVLKAAWSAEKAKTGVGYVIRLRNGAVEIVPIRRNPMLYVLEREIQTALITQKQGSKIPATALEGHGHIGQGKDAKKISFTAYDRDVVHALGYVHRVKQYGRVDSHADLRDQVKRDYAAGIRVNDTISVQHQGIPFIVRGDGVQVKLPAEGYSGKQSFVYCTRANHVVQAGVYTTNWDFTLVDPFVAELEAEQKAAAARAAKHGSRSRDLTGSSSRWLVVASAEDDPPGTSASCGPLPSDRRGYSVLTASGLSSDAGTAGQALSVGSVWPCGVDMKITNPSSGKSVTAPHVDNGAGSSFRPVVGIYPQTRADLGLSGGQFNVIIERVDGQAFTPARGSKV